MRKSLLFLGLVSAIIISCKGNSEDNYDSTFNFNNGTEVTLGSAVGSKSTLTFTVDYEWSLDIPSDAQSWLAVDKSSGRASRSVLLTFSALEENTGEERTAQCTLKAGKNKETITVTQKRAAVILTASEVQDYDKIYKPSEFNYDWLRSDVTWSFCRSKQSEHFIVFWGYDYGEYGLYGDRVGEENTSPATLKSTDTYYVDIDDLLEKAEEFYRVNIDELKFADTESGKSNLNKYKMEIYILHQSEWLATGGGYDDVIGALWINPSTCKPVGSTIAHEIGHSFQYMVYADQIANGANKDYSTGWRYSIGQGCGFWEQCAQWQSYQSYAEQAFSSYNFTVFIETCSRHFIHEHQRYASYFLQWYWAEKYGVQEIGELWRESKSPEDPCETYMRKHSLSVAEFNNEIYEYAAKCATWDFDVEATNLYEGQLTGVTQSVRDFGKDYIGKIGWKGSYDSSTGYYSVDPSLAPEATGFNHIRLNLPESGSNITVNFTGMPNASGYQSVSTPANAGWTVGYVALLEDGSREYSDPVLITSSADVSYSVPSTCKKLWFVVACTPSVYMTHEWDEDDTNDELWPYKVKLNNTDLFGNITFTGDETPKSITIEHNISTSAAAGYSGSSYTLSDDDLVDMAYAFVLQPSEIQAKIPSDRSNVASGEVKFAAVETSGLSYNYTANGYGFWFAADGSVAAWSSAYTYCEFAPSTWTFQFGIHPTRYTEGNLKVGDVYTQKMALVYGDYTVTFKFNVTITE